MTQYKYTIIIPHKNIPDLLQRCLDSIPKRDDVQIIIVDDNSNPTIVNFEHFPGQNQVNIEIYFDKSDNGAGGARNVGLKHAKGEWILFADSDDYYNTENLNELFNQNIPSGCNIVFWGIRHKRFDGSIWIDTINTEEILSYQQSKELFIRGFAPWRKMVRNSIIKANDIKFEEIVASNDVMFHMHVMAVVDARNILFFSKCIYTWVQRTDSITHIISLEKTICRFMTSLRANRFSLKHGWGIIDYTIVYQEELYKISHLRFFFSFYWACIYIGWIRATFMYRKICCDYNERLCLYLHPSLFIQTLIKKILPNGILSQNKKTPNTNQ